MKDREDVIKGLEICVHRVPGKYDCNECPYEIDGDCCAINLTNDALSMLKEQEERIKLLEHQLETLTKWRMSAGAFD